MSKFSLHQALKQADLLAKNGQLEHAQSLYQKVLHAFPKNKIAKQEVDRLAALSRLRVNQLPPQSMINELLSMYNEGRFELAANQAEYLTGQYPDSFAIWNILGAANKGLGRVSEASEAFKRVIDLNPQYPDGFNNLGVTLQQQGKFDDALECFMNALSLNPDYVEAHFNAGEALQSQGKFAEAITSFERALALCPHLPAAHNNIGNSLKSIGKLKDAIASYNKALALKADFAEAHNNLGNALKDQGKLEYAIASYEKALASRTDFVECFYNMGNALYDLGNLKEATAAYEKALSIKPCFAEAHNNMGNSLKDQGKLGQALVSYEKALSFKSDYEEAYYNFGNVLRDLSFHEADPKIEAAILALLDGNKRVRPNAVAKAILSFVECQLPNLELSQDLILNFEKIINHLAATPLLLKLMAVCPLPDLKWERLFSNIRSYILNNIDQISVNPCLLKVQSALALQCFMNEYIYNLDKNDEKALHDLVGSVSNDLAKNSQPSPHVILCIASFKALHEYDWSNKLQRHVDLNEVLKRHVEEPYEEEILKTEIARSDKITDGVSINVQEQYEESPYPRWVGVGIRYKPATVAQIVKDIELKISIDEILRVDTPEVLIAGCGTGQQSIESACRFKDSRVLAVDLSMSSLAYAKRKSQELKVSNVDYMQADILWLRNLNRRFDIIECTGVLHHMNEPIDGWKALVDCLKPGGLIKIALYSELARDNITQIRKEISDLGFEPTVCNMREFRNSLINSIDLHHKRLFDSVDFYSLSTFRDLIFHVQEHRFTLHQIRDCLGQLGLKFCGFEADSILRAFKASNNSKCAEYDLNEWNVFEQRNPKIFAGMYQFWCQKVY